MISRQKHLTGGTIIDRAVNEHRSGVDQVLLALDTRVAALEARRNLVSFSIFEQPAAWQNLVLAATTWTNFLQVEADPDPNGRQIFAVIGSAAITIPAGINISFRLVAGTLAFPDNQYSYNACPWLWSDTIFHLPPAGKKIVYRIQVYATGAGTITYRNRGILAVRGWN